MKNTEATDKVLAIISTYVKEMLKMHTYLTVKRLLGYISPAETYIVPFKEILDISNKSPSLEWPAEALYSFL